MSTKAETRRVASEFAIAFFVGLVAAFAFPPSRMEKVDEMLVTFLSIVVGAAVPGVALTAAAQRPSADTPKDAQRLGDKLENQVRFWFGFLLFGGLSVCSLIAGRAVDWTLTAPPAPAWASHWMPEGGAWLVFASFMLASFTVIRARRIVGAVLALVRLGTAVDVERANKRRQQRHEQVAKQIRQLPPAPSRGPLRERGERGERT